MRSSTNLMVLCLLTLCCFSFTGLLAPATAFAGWGDDSDELPGMHDFPTELVVLGGALIAGLIIYKIAKKDDNSGDLPEAPSSDDPTDAGDDADPDKKEQAYLETPKTLLTSNHTNSGLLLGVYVDLDQDKRSPNPAKLKPSLSELSFKAGLTLRF